MMSTTVRLAAMTLGRKGVTSAVLVADPEDLGVAALAGVRALLERKKQAA